MQIEHAAMYVRDLEGARRFFETYLEARSGPLYENKQTGFRSFFLTFDGGARLELMCAPRMEDAARSPARTGYAHLAFRVGSREKVDGLTARLEADGFGVVSPPRTTGDGYYESCVADAEGNRIELTV